MKKAKALLTELLESSWYGRSRWSLLLLPLAWVFGLLAAIRRLAYRLGIFKVVRASIPVIVVGNISVGGTGKTPVVGWLVNRLKESGYSPAIVSRGYGGQKFTQAHLLSTSSQAAEVGDEPLLLQQLTGCPVAVCTDRAAAVALVAANGADVVISDDGLQHYRMHRDVEIVVIDGQRGFGNGFLLPAGPLREPVSRLQSVEAVLINQGSGKIPGFHFCLRQQGAISLDGGSHRDLKDFADREVWAIAGIGNPQRFYNELREAGLIVHEIAVPDHGTVSIEALLANKKLPVFMTAKDAVKYTAREGQELWYVPVDLDIDSDDAVAIFNKITGRLEQYS
jgi:tetraacyldisaccharide 4'-kinase